VLNALAGQLTVHEATKIEGTGNAPWGVVIGSVWSAVFVDGVTAITNNAFEHCTAMESVSIPKSVTSIGRGVLFSCENLSSIAIPSSVETIAGIHSLIARSWNRLMSPKTRILSLLVMPCSAKTWQTSFAVPRQCMTIMRSPTQSI